MTNPIDVDIAAVQAAYDQAEADLVEVRAALVTAQSQIADLTAGAQTNAATIATLTAQVASLEAQLAAALTEIQGLDPETQFGIDPNNEDTPTQTKAQAVAALRTAIGGGLGQHAKFFDGGKGVAAGINDFAGSTYGQQPNERHPVICIKAGTVADFTAGITRMVPLLHPGEHFYFTPQQEVKDAGSLANAVALTKAINTARVAHPNGIQVRINYVINGYTVVEGASIPSLADPVMPLLDVTRDAAGHTRDVLDWDLYAASTRSASYTLQLWTAKLAAYAAAHDIDWAVGECGWTGSHNTAAEIQAFITWCKTTPGFRWANIWPAPTSWPFIGTPAQPTWTAAMTAAMTQAA